MRLFSSWITSCVAGLGIAAASTIRQKFVGFASWLPAEIRYDRSRGRNGVSPFQLEDSSVAFC